MDLFGPRCRCADLTRVLPEGYQYCRTCGRAHRPPRLRPCLRHALENVGDEYLIRQLRSRTTAQMQTQRCTACGQYFTYDLTNGNYTIDCGPMP